MRGPAEKAVILAGGAGTRLRPYTRVLPKPLLPIGEQPILEIIIRQLHDAGMRDITVATGYLSSLIESYFGAGESLGVNISYAREEHALGTAGPLTQIDGLDDTFILMNGDVLSDLDYGHLLAAHRRAGAAATIATQRRSVELDYGIVEVDGGLGGLRRIAAMKEKPRHVHQVSMGVYAFEPTVLGYLPTEGTPMDFPELIDRLLAAGEPVAAYQHEGYWADVGQAHSLEEAVEEFERRAERFVRHRESPSPSSIDRLHEL